MPKNRGHRTGVDIGIVLPAVLLTLTAFTAAESTFSAACDPAGPFGLPGIDGPPEQFGQWSAVLDWPAQATHAAMLPTGQVLWWRNGEPTPTYLWDPDSQLLSAGMPVDTNVFCAGHTSLHDGRTFVIGGTVDFTNHLGAPDANVFDATSGTWTLQADMAHGRWYPTATALPDGTVLAVSGSVSPGVKADIPEIYDPATDSWTSLIDAQLVLPNYPYNFVLPDGRVLTAGPGTLTAALDLESGQWQPLTAARHTSAFAGSAAMVRPGVVVRVGGGNPATADVDLIDMNLPGPGWREIAPMAHARRRPNFVLLPDGSALVVGGATASQSDPECAVHAAEIFDPVGESWFTVASMARPRIYHSIAILLPDARVLVAGGENLAVSGGEKTAEIYSPPYLFKGQRPVIQGVSESIEYGAPFHVVLDDRDVIAAMALMRPGSVTHNFDQNQRYLALDFSPGPGKKKLLVSAPANANLAPPGTYMLFAINDDGVPSLATFVSIGTECVVTETPEVSCNDEIDNDCDGQTDGNDNDCAIGMCDADAVCDLGETCQSCPSDCEGRHNGKPAGRFCCGDGILQSAEGDGSVCDGNP